MSLNTKAWQLALCTALLAGCASAVPEIEEPREGTSLQTEAATQDDVASTSQANVANVAADTAALEDIDWSRGFLARDDVRQFHQEVSESRRLPAGPVAALLSEAQYDDTARRLMRPRPPGRGPIVRDWPTYRKRFVEPIRIKRGRAFMQDHATLLNEAEKRYGVPASIIAAIIGVETLYGQHMGNFKVLDTVTTLAFDYPDHPRHDERTALFREQLADLIELHLHGKLDARNQYGSFAGAMGLGQFMPTSIKKYAVSAQPPRPIDLEHNLDDAIFSVANFLRAHGWVPGAPVFAPVRIPAGPAAQLMTGGLEPTLDWATLQKAGATLAPGAKSSSWQSLPLGIIDLPTARTGQVQYRVATPNFFALTHYNRSYFYATSVAQLAQAISEPHQSVKDAR